MASQRLSASEHQPVPFYRDVRIIAILIQIAFVIVVGLLLWWLYSNMITSLRRSNIPTSFAFLRQTAGFAFETPIAYQPTDTYARAFVGGVVNTLRVTLLGIVLATILGVMIGIGRLSSNWLLRNVAGAYVTIIRNTPLLVQLIFWYVAVILKLPRVRNAVGVDGLILMSNRGLAVAWPRPADSFGAWTLWLWLGLVVGVAVYAWRRWQLQRADRPGTAWPHGLLGAGLTVLLGGVVVAATSGTSPLRIDTPELGNFNFSGGTTLEPEYFALLLGLTIYTAAFIAEVVRGGILAVNKGQREAAQALALSPMQTLRLVIFPQALRVIIPPLTNQYLNLTKNSSLGIAVGYFDLFNVAGTSGNQSGAIVQVFLILMAFYLSISLITSLLMNLYNARIRLVER
jgi:general L-amino acid transport system permease protein